MSGTVRFRVAEVRRIDRAIELIEETDQHRNLGVAIPIILFLMSGGLAVRSFFWLVDLTTWLGVGELNAVLPSSVSFVLLFVVWVFAFLSSMSAMEKLKFVDIREVTRGHLLNLELSELELRKLQELLTSRNLRHHRLIQSAIDEIASQSHF